MPHYEYECTVCKHRFELLQKFSDEPAKVCIRCGAPVVRLLSSPAIQFKGTGWYVTDYAGKSGPSADNNKKGSGEKTSTSSEGNAASKDSGPPTDKPAKT